MIRPRYAGLASDAAPRATFADERMTGDLPDRRHRMSQCQWTGRHAASSSIAYSCDAFHRVDWRHQRRADAAADAAAAYGIVGASSWSRSP